MRRGLEVLLQLAGVAIAATLVALGTLPMIENRRVLALPQTTCNFTADEPFNQRGAYMITNASCHATLLYVQFPPPMRGFADAKPAELADWRARTVNRTNVLTYVDGRVAGYTELLSPSLWILAIVAGSLLFVFDFSWMSYNARVLPRTAASKPGFDARPYDRVAAQDDPMFAISDEVDDIELRGHDMDVLDELEQADRPVP